ncbi:thiaminase II [Enterococcus sp. 2201sp1_2201st1_B8_2201SCRN_220225]|uniref:thiaminase II n=1 Tax=unclassified Enterococcus TaxID=2608891 RepID=UPI0034A4909E
MVTFTEKARKIADPYWQGSFTHDFVTQLQAGTLDKGVFRYYLLQDRYYLEHFSKLYDLIAQKTENSEIRQLMKENSQNLAEGELFIRKEFFQELAITPEEIRDTAIAPTAYHYISHLYRQLAEGDVVAACAGMLPCPWLYQEIGTKLVTLGSPEPLYQRWIATYATEAGAQQLQREREILDRLASASTHLQQEKMLQAFLISSQMEYQFWEMAMTLESWPQGVNNGKK